MIFLDCSMRRDTVIFGWLDRDARHELRVLRRNPGFTALAVLSLGFAIGAATTMFSVIDALDFRALPFRDGDRLVWLAEVTPSDHFMCSRCAFLTSPPTVLDWSAQARSFDPIAALAPAPFSWQHDDVVEPLTANQVTPNFFGLLGVRPLLGRVFLPSDTEPGTEPSVLLSYDFWRNRFGGDRNVVGREMRASYEAGDSSALRTVTVIGVLPKDFRLRARVDIWGAMRLDPNSARTARLVTAVARMRPGHSRASATTELEAISTRLARSYPDAYREWGASVQPLRDVLGWGVENGRYRIFAITMLVVLMAVLNVAGLLLARTMARQHEYATRSALGASHIQLLRQRLVEGSCIGLAGGLIGVLLALWGVRFAARWFAVETVRVGIDYRVLIFAAALSWIVGVAAALVPAIRAKQTDLIRSLRGRGAAGAGAIHVRRSNALVTGQIAVGILLLAAAGLLSADYLELRYLDLGYEPRGLYVGSIAGTREQSDDPASFRAVAEAVRAGVATIPGVVSASVTHESRVHPTVVRPVRQESFQHSGSTPVVRAVDTDHFATWRIRLLQGRTFIPADRYGEPLVAIVDRTAASTFWPGQNPLGRSIFTGDSLSNGELLTVIGVVDDVERGDMADRHWPTVYRPLRQADFYHTGASLAMKIAVGRPEAISAAEAWIRQATSRPGRAFRSEEEALDARLLPHRLNAIALDLFAGFTLILVAIGIYGNIAYMVTQRTREIGIRLALGADPRSALMLVARRGVRLAAGGVCVGVVAALALRRILASLISGTSVMNPWVLAGTSCLMLAVALFATWLPARRATRVDPVISMRTE